jgi:hypothetical protein
MTLLSRITSRDKDHGDKPAEAPSQKPSVGRDEVEPKPSLLRRLSRRNSASKGQKPKEMGLGEVNTTAMSPADKRGHSELHFHGILTRYRAVFFDRSWRLHCLIVRRDLPSLRSHILPPIMRILGPRVPRWLQWAPVQHRIQWNPLL